MAIINDKKAKIQHKFENKPCVTQNCTKIIDRHFYNDII